TGTSANRSGQPPPQCAADVMQQLGLVIDLIVDGGPAPGGQPSTVLQILPELRILRDGAVTRKQLEVVLGQPSLWFRK
ncbi:MAG TPA: Sua5/YciO/YrdC/YwlC family protein, partial [Cyclobacteriaceae bacterium]|nr:Sua5/YciO/YrdC/YwlC family protein [Cyclobacteriaceae bacterium]